MAHTVNLAVLPFVGLPFSSTIRRATRGRPGPPVGPASANARRADRIVMATLIALTLGAIAGTLIPLAFALMGL